MKRIVLSLALLLTIGATCADAWTLVNTSATFFWGNNQTTSTAKNHAAGTLIVVLVSGGSSSTISSVTNTAADTFVQATNARHTGIQWTDIWYVLSSIGNASDVITVTVAGTDQGSLFVANYSYSGSATFNVANNGIENGSANTATTGALATVATGNLLVANGFYATGGLGTWTAGSGMTLQVAEASGQGQFEDNQNASAGSQTVSITNSTGSTGVVVISAAAFSIAAGCTDSHMLGVWRCDEAAR